MRPLCIRTPATPKRPAPFSAAARARHCGPGRRVCMETSLPLLGVALQSSAPARSVGLVCACRPRNPARDRLRRRRASDRAGRAQSRLRLHRRRALPQRDGEGARRDRSEGSHAISGCIMATRPTCSPGFRNNRSIASTCSIPTPGRSGGTGSGASCRIAASRRSRAC